MSALEYLCIGTVYNSVTHDVEWKTAIYNTHCRSPGRFQQYSGRRCLRRTM